MQKEYLPVGNHLLIDLYNCNTCEFNEQQFRGLLKGLGFKTLEYTEHIFKPQGKTAVILLSESHLAIHTYPEWKYIAVDLYTCGLNNKTYDIINKLTDLFNPENIKMESVYRGIK